MMSSSFDLSTYITSTLLSPRAPDVSAIKRQDLVKDFDEKTHANVVLLDLGVRDLEDLKSTQIPKMETFISKFEDKKEISWMTNSCTYLMWE